MWKRVSFLKSFKLGFTCTWVELSTARSLNARTGGGSDGARRGCDPGAMLLEKTQSDGHMAPLRLCHPNVFLLLFDFFNSKFYQVSTHP